MTATNEKVVKLTDNIAPKFIAVHNRIKEGKYSSYWLKGGRGSTKSSFVAIEIILGILGDPEANAFVTRKVGDTIRLSVMNTLLWAISKLEVGHLFKYTFSPSEITYVPTGQKIILKGLDDPLKIKSIKIEKGYFKYLWFEEAAEFSGPQEIRSVEQSILRGGDVFVEFVTYNPPNDPAAWVNRESGHDIPNRLVHESTYLDVPAHWLGKKFIEDAETLKLIDPVAYQHEYMGIAVGRAEQIIFHGKWEAQEFTAPEEARFYFGADWGFSNDPTALVRCFILDENLYIDYEAVGHGVEIDETATLFDAIPGARQWPIKGDNSRPETISYVKRQGFNLYAAEKWKGSVEDGIAHIKGFRRIIVHPRCIHLIKELNLYSYKVDKISGDILPIVTDKYNHCIAAGELVETLRGQVPIEKVIAGDYVITRDGWKRVLNSWEVSKDREIWQLRAGNFTLKATPDHKVFVVNKGFVRIDALSYNDVLLTYGASCKNSPSKKLNLWVQFIADTLTPKRDQIAFTSNRVTINGCIEKYGNILLEKKFLKGFISITSTVIHRITHSIIWNAFLRKLIGKSTRQQKILKLGALFISKVFARLQKLGTLAKKELLSIEKSAQWHIKHLCLRKNNAGSAVKHFRQESLGIKIYSAQTPVSLQAEESQASMTKSEYAKLASQNSILTNTRKIKFVRVPVSEVSIIGRSPVYDLTVEDKHEFVASGILVHNCIDAIRYALDDFIHSRDSIRYYQRLGED